MLPAASLLLVGMKTERKRMGLSAIIFVYIFFCRSENEYKNPGNEYGNRYYRKHTRSEYKADMETKIGIDQNLKAPLIMEKYTQKQTSLMSC